jgi:predicted transcriptional regulator
MANTNDPGFTTVRLPVSIVDAMRHIAKAHDRSMVAKLRVALTNYIGREETVAVSA